MVLIMDLLDVQYEYKIESKNSHHCKFVSIELTVYPPTLTGAILYGV